MSPLDDPQKRRRSDGEMPPMSTPPSAMVKPGMSETSLNVAKQLQSTLKILVIFTVLLYLIMGAIVVWTYKQSAKNTDALCAVKIDAQRRVTQAQEFLKENPSGVAGISREQLLRSSSNSKATVKALKILSCPPPTLLDPNP